MNDSLANSNNIQNSKDEKIMQQAELWLARLGNDSKGADISADVSEDFNSWLNEDLLHIKAFDSVQNIYESFDLVSDEILNGELGLIDPAMISGIPANDESMSVAKSPNVTSIFIQKKIYALAAAVVMTITGTLLTLHTPKIDTVYYQTAVGESQHLALNDGSVIDLNTQTQIAVNYSEQFREITLTSGEMHLGVASNKSRPMLIDAGDIQVKVVGTEFNVAKLLDAITVSVVEGIVDVSKSNAFGNPEIIRLTANQTIEYSVNGGFGEVKQIPIANVSSWKDGFLMYDTNDLNQVINDINRYQTKLFVIADDELKQMEVSGIIHLENMDIIVETLESVFPISAIENEKGEVLLYRRQ